MKFPIKALALFLFVGVGLVARAAELPVSTHWQSFKTATDRSAPAIMTDYSYAGYTNGERGIPTVKGPVFKVTDYGAIPDDLKSDEKAIRDAIAAAEKAGGGVVFFPPGKFLVWADRAKVESIHIRSSNIVLRGAGSSKGGTLIRAIHSGYGNGLYPVPKTGPDFAAIPYIFSFDTTSEASSTEATANLKSLSTSINRAVKRASVVLPVESTAGFAAGDWVSINSKSIKLNDELMCGLEPDPAWKRVQEGAEIREYHQIKAIGDNSLILAEPVLLNLGADFGARVDRITMLKEVGVEDIAFQGGWRAEFVHHRSALDDEGWDGILFDGVANGWVRRCAFMNINTSVYLMRSSSCSVLQNRISGSMGHYNVAVRSTSSFNLMGLSYDQAGHLHGVSTGNRSSATTVWRWDLKQNQSVDSHGNAPYCTLIDCVNGGTFTQSGGPALAFPHHLTGMVFWNFKYNADTDVMPINLWRGGRSGAKFVKPLFVGLHGLPVELNAEALTANESPGLPMAPESLYEAQLQLRLKALPAWVGEARREWEVLSRQALPFHGTPCLPNQDVYEETFQLADLLRDFEGLMKNQQLGWAVAVSTSPVPATVQLTRDYGLLRTILHQLCTYASPRPTKERVASQDPVKIEVTVTNREVTIHIPLTASAADRTANKAALTIATELAPACRAIVKAEPKGLILTIGR